MAQITICDVKACGDIIKSHTEIKNTNIAGTMYQLCKKCYDGLMKFTDDNLIKPSGADAPIVKLDGAAKDILEYMQGVSNKPQSQWPLQPNTLYGFSTPRAPFYGGVTLTNPGFYVTSNDVIIGDGNDEDK